MRAIEFRGKRLDNGEWVYGYLYKLTLPSGEACMILTQDNNHLDNSLEPKYHLAFTLWVDLFLVDPNSVGQYTGLVDKNGRKIYEGDILKVKEFENLLMKDFDDDPNRFELFSLDEIRGELQCEIVKPVKVEETNFAVGEYYLDCFYGDMRRSSPIFDIEVLGNVYDNNDLLGKS